ncbi:hypothetical protein TSUD_387470 [Trifolium subterraneum]|uniref:Uncharacterized protein n=1 Tax=Trifolium subterraneum TaxID=3900 RepID=A0A2Z6NE18_TRISU|nr:hypothetical protein TSUD_387470 [Trifolium subterraneum]
MSCLSGMNCNISQGPYCLHFNNVTLLMTDAELQKLGNNTTFNYNCCMLNRSRGYTIESL